jgi:hypothetical protein
MTLRPGDIDAAAAGGGGLAAMWNFVIGGQLNVLIGAIVGVLSIAVLLQRYRINRREIARKNQDPAG